MAIAQSLRGKGWGEFPLVQALKRAALGSAQGASWAVAVDAKAGARDFYFCQDFTPLPARPERLFIQLKTIEEMFEL
jgi:hypothetical protein